MTDQAAASRVTEELAGFAAGLTWSDIPEPARHAARRTVANVVGLAVGASRHAAVDTAVASLAQLGAFGDCSVLGRSERLSVTWAPLVNGIGMHVEDFDDTHLRTVLHPGAPVTAAALAVAEVTRASGVDLLTAVAGGVEVAARVANGICPGHFDQGWHVTGTMGHLGAVVAAGHLLRLDSGRLRHAMALAATQAAGHTEQLGSMTKSLHPGKAASDGVEAALLAAEGLAGPQLPIEGRRGLAALMSPTADLAAMLEGLGDVWELEDNAFKPYACGIVSHPVIDAGIGVRNRGLDADQVDAVELVVNPVVLEVMGIEEPATGLQSKFSVYHCFTVGLLDGVAGPAQYTDERTTAGDAARLRRRIRVRTDPGIPKDGCRCVVRLRGGDLLTEDVHHATGSLAKPMTDLQLRAKFELVASPVLGTRWRQAWNAAFGVDQLNEVADLTDACRAAGTG